MRELSLALQKLGLEHYTQSLFDEGFETWEQVMDVTEADLESVGLKLGHRRRLQRAIQDARDQSGQAPLQHATSTSTADLRTSGDPPSVNADETQRLSEDQAAIPTKRKYRRHPKPDPNGPERPPSAYVLFSNRVRERVKGRGLSFTEIAKIVGEQWQDPDPEERTQCEHEAIELKNIYYRKLEEYKKTPEYHEYNEYLAEFREKHAEPATKDSKRARSNATSPIALNTTSLRPSGVDQLAGDTRPDNLSEFNKSARSSLSTSTSTSMSQGWRPESYTGQIVRTSSMVSSAWDSNSATQRTSVNTLSPTKSDHASDDQSRLRCESDSTRKRADGKSDPRAEWNVPPHKPDAIRLRSAGPATDNYGRNSAEESRPSNGLLGATIHEHEVSGLDAPITLAPILSPRHDHRGKLGTNGIANSGVQLPVIGTGGRPRLELPPLLGSKRHEGSNRHDSTAHDHLRK